MDTQLTLGLVLLLAGTSTVIGEKLNAGCLGSMWTLICDATNYKVVSVTSVESDTTCGPVDACTDEQTAQINGFLQQTCTGKSSCRLRQQDIVSGKCASTIRYNCIQGNRTTPRPVQTTPIPEDAWQTDYESWQWVIIWIILAVILVALIILLIMLINRCCFKMFNQEKPKFVETTPNQSQMNSALNSRSVSMSTLHRPPPVKKEVTQEEIDEVRAQFGTNRKKKDKDKYFGQGVGSLDSRRSSGDGASGDANGKYFTGDDSSSGIGSATYDSRLKHALYDDTDTCHDDIVAWTMKKQAKSALVNPVAYNTLTNPKRVDEELYSEEAPTVDIHEDRREENFRLDINSWDINRHLKDDNQVKPDQNGVANAAAPNSTVPDSTVPDSTVPDSTVPDNPE